MTKLCFAVLISCEQGVEFMQERISLDIISAVKIARVNSPFDSNNDILNFSEKIKFRNIIAKYSSRIGNFNSYGYAGISLLLGFFYNTPDNTLPIFWSPNCTDFPLLKRDNLGRGFTTN